MLRAYILFVIIGLASPATAAEVYGCLGHDVCLNGLILHGDAAQFAAVTRGYPAGTFIWLSGPGGYIEEALDIGDIIQKRGFSTAVSVNTGLCGSACAILFLSGHHAVIQRNSLLIFHEGSDARTGQPMNDGDTAYFADRISTWGVTKGQAWALLHAAPVTSGRVSTEAWAYSLGFHFQSLPNFLWLWRSCSAKFCVAG